MFIQGLEPFCQFFLFFSSTMEKERKNQHFDVQNDFKLHIDLYKMYLKWTLTKQNLPDAGTYQKI